MSEPQDPVAVARQMRAALKERFPGVRFSVRTEKFGFGSSSIRVQWTGGPSTAQVNKITGPFESVRRDGWGEILGGMNRFVFSARREADLS